MNKDIISQPQIPSLSHVAFLWRLSGGAAGYEMKTKHLISIILFQLLIFTSQAGAQNSLWEMMPLGANFSDIRCIYHDTTTNNLYVGSNTHVLLLDTINCITYWDGVKWNALGSGASNGASFVTTIARYNDTIYAGGAFDEIYGSPGTGIMKWNGVSWGKLGLESCEGINKKYNCCGSVCSITPINGSLYVAGIYDTIGCLNGNGIGVWNSNSWLTIDSFPNNGSGCCNKVVASCLFDSNLYVAGNFYSVDSNGNNIAYYNGVEWKTPGGGFTLGYTEILDMIVFKNQLYVAGRFKASEGNPGNNIVCWNGSEWNDLFGGTDYQINDLLVHDEKLYAVGGFTEAGGIPASRIATWDGTKWCSLGSSIDGAINCAEFYNDTLLIGGGFDHIDGQLLYYFAKWLGGDYIDTCSTPVGIYEINSAQFDFSISPNPATSQLNITLTTSTKPYQLKILNTLGQTIQKQAFSSPQLSINIADLPSGIYFLEVQNDPDRSGERAVKKFVKQGY